MSRYGFRFYPLWIFHNRLDATQSAVTQTDIMQALVSDVESAENERNNAENLRIQQAIDVCLSSAFRNNR